jgi:hypothetical protein
LSLTTTKSPVRRKFIKPAVARDILDCVIPHDQIFTVRFIKKDGSEREMNCRRGVAKDLVGARRNASPNAITVYDLEISDYRAFNLNRILEIRGNGISVTATK